MATGVVLYEREGENSGLDVNGEKDMHTSIMRMKMKSVFPNENEGIGGWVVCSSLHEFSGSAWAYPSLPSLPSVHLFLWDTKKTKIMPRKKGGFIMGSSLFSKKKELA